MKPLYSTNTWPKIAAYDVEADVWVDITLLCHVDEYGNRKHWKLDPTQRKSIVARYLDWLYSDWEGDVLFAHAGGRYDHRFLLAEAHERGWSIRAAISGNSIVVLTISNGKRSIKFVDSYRLMPDGLKQIGDTVGLPKLDVDASELSTKYTPAEVLEYCYRDCDIVVRGLQLMRDTLTAVGADFAFTLASIAARYNRRSPGIKWNHFVTKNADGKQVPHPRIKEWDAACFDAYYGGRCEAFVKGEIHGPVYWYDIVSSYPTSMLEPLPLYYMGYYAPPRNMVDPTHFLSYCGITECTVDIPPMHIGILPVREKKTRRLEFPHNSIVEGRWTNIELLEAIKQGCKIVSIVGQYRFKAVPFLRGFVQTFYALRKKAKAEKDAFSSYAYKILLNSSYGKLTETIDRRGYISETEIPRVQAEAHQSGREADIRTTATAGFYVLRTEEVGPFRHTAAGAYVTAYSRLRLYRMAKHMHDQGAIVYYCDTDSLIVSKRIETIGTGLGDWEHVDDLSFIEIVLPKVYKAVSATGKATVYKCKGCPIVRRFEPPEMAELRWQAFKNFRHTESESDSEILGKDGVTGFITDVNYGSLHPRRLQELCKTCEKTGVYQGLECPVCAGKGFKPKPLVRSLKSDDRKREWSGQYSMPGEYGPGKRTAMPLPDRKRPKPVKEATL